MDEFNEVTKKKGRAGLIVTIIILILLLIGALGYIAYDKGYLDKLLGKEEPVKEEVKKEEPKISKEEVEELQESLVTDSKRYGLYFKEDTSIDTISSKKFIQYAIANYADDKDLDTKGDKSAKISKSELDNYIKEKYNTDKVFELKKEDSDRDTISGINIDVGMEWDKDYASKEYTIINYDANSAQYNLTKIATGTQEEVTIFNDSDGMKYEQKGDEVYIYDTALFCFKSFHGEIGCAPFVDYYHNVDKDRIVFEYNPNDGGSKPDYIESDGDINEDYVFKNMSDKLNKYKHTFKKGDNGKYYWYSSEIVK